MNRELMNSNQLGSERMIWLEIKHFDPKIWLI